MKALINLNNGTTVTLDGTAEEISDCYIQILQGVIELNHWFHDEFDSPDEPDEEVPELPDDTVDKLLDYISRTRNISVQDMQSIIEQQDEQKHIGQNEGNQNRTGQNGCNQNGGNDT